MQICNIRIMDLHDGLHRGKVYDRFIVPYLDDGRALQLDCVILS